MKKLSILFAIFMMMNICSPVWAQKVKGMGMVDLGYVVTESKAGKQAQAQLQAIEQEMIERITPLRNEFIQMQNDYLEQEKKLNQAQKDAKLAELQQKRAEFENASRFVSAEIQKNSVALTNKIVNEVKEVVNQVMKEKKMNVILDMDSVIVSDDIPDITEDVLIKYNLKYK